MQFDLSPITRLIDAKYEKETALRAVGIDSFVPALRFQESLARNPNELAEYREFISQACRNNIIIDKMFNERLLALKQEAVERNKASGNYWDLQLTKFERHYWQESIEHENSMNERKRPFEIEMTGLFENELLFFNRGYAKRLGGEIKKTSAAKSLYSNLVGSAMSDMGFRLDREYKSSGELAFAKHITPKLDLRLLVDLPSLLQRVGGPKKNAVTGQWLPPSGPSLVTWLQLHDSSIDHIQARIMLHWLFPIREFPLGAKHYSKFYEMDELESLINIQLVMYRIVISDIEQAFLGEPLCSGACVNI
jgi:hypothetical protein